MKHNINAEQIRSLYHAEPFRPFELITDSGHRVHVKSRNRLVISPTGRFVLVVGEADSIRQVNLDRVTAIDMRASRLRQDHSGESRRRKAG